MKNKTVYILGAGFSMSAGAPSQEKLIEEVFKLHNTLPYIFQMTDAIQDFKNFLSKQMCIPEGMQKDVPLEDVFTPIDRCLLDNLSFRGLSVDLLKDLREKIYYLIAKTLQHLLSASTKDYIDSFAKHLVVECQKRSGRQYANIDNVSVISTNWDILLDRSIYEALRPYGNDGVVDYCCHVSSFDPNDETVKPGLEKLGMGGFNVKLLKLHGSLNWLHCPRCQRVYVDAQNKIAVEQYLHPENCRHCQKNFPLDVPTPLSANLIMPTFLKNLSNPQYKIIWQNAGIELSEAAKVVFIGYSLPQADYEMRQLLSRMVRSDASIEVVGYSLDPTTDILFQQLENRYRVFFGNRPITFHHRGAEAYILDKFSCSLK